MAAALVHSRRHGSWSGELCTPCTLAVLPCSLAGAASIDSVVLDGRHGCPADRRHSQNETSRTHQAGSSARRMAASVSPCVSGILSGAGPRITVLLAGAPGVAGQARLHCPFAGRRRAGDRSNGLWALACGLWPAGCLVAANSPRGGSGTLRALGTARWALQSTLPRSFKQMVARSRRARVVSSASAVESD